MRLRLREMDELHRILDRLGERGRIDVLTHVEHEGSSFPIYGIVVGNPDPTTPTFALIGGVHGLERIGTRVVLAYMHTLVELLGWDRVLNGALERSRLVFVPIVNPIGMAMRTRSNPAGVDLMRNAPVHAESIASPLVGGQRISPRLPWYMGREGDPMQPEAAALCDFVRRELFESSFAISLDVHSGFGFVDRLWFPYARTRKPFSALREVYALKTLLDATLPNHVYRVEPQSRSYTTHGDLWDHLHDQHQADRQSTYLPLTLEMGSWTWVKKNPRQAFSLLGSFNPIKPHRLRRTLRRHVPLLDFLHRATASSTEWIRSDGPESAAFELWYGD